MQFIKNKTQIVIQDGVERTPEVDDLIEKMLNYQIEWPMRISKTEHGTHMSKVPADRLESYRKNITPLTVPIDDKMLTIYPVFGYRLSDITPEDIADCIEFSTDSIFIGMDDDGELYVGP